MPPLRPLIDADAHVYEPGELWQHHVDPAFRDQAPTMRAAPDRPRLSWSQDTALMARIEATCRRLGVPSHEAYDWIATGSAGPVDLVYDGKPVWEGLPPEAAVRGAAWIMVHHLEGFLARFSPESYVRVLGRQGVQRAHLHPSAGLWVLAIDTMPANLAAALARAYNDWLLDFCAHDPAFLRPVGAMPQHDPKAMAAEVRRLATKGVRTVTIRPNPFRGRMIGTPDFEVFWQAITDTDMTVTLHEGSHARVATTGGDRFRSQFGRHSTSHPTEQMMALLSLIENGVFIRHPTLRIGILEAGCGWLPYWLWRLDELEWRNLGWELSASVPEPPSTYFRRHCFVSCEPEEPGIETVINQFGEDCVVFGSDYPHTDHSADISQDIQRLVDRLGERMTTRILWDNPLRWFGA
ncbi:MAG: amidohydrolase family protein [Myxococcota bacterium]